MVTDYVIIGNVSLLPNICQSKCLNHQSLSKFCELPFDLLKEFHVIDETRFQLVKLLEHLKQF